ncbi:hypothetical protein RIF29_27162 [Crotalaria pallida]|uniref:Uncharacterized protein n=1 Tax=Crotalaria pallida TaxID=3830 RepID=A0AAN9EPI8_CROPI
MAKTNWFAFKVHCLMACIFSILSLISNGYGVLSLSFTAMLKRSRTITNVDCLLAVGNKGRVLVEDQGIDNIKGSLEYIGDIVC